MSSAGQDDFYVRYYVGHKGKFGHEFLEIEFRPDGKVRRSAFGVLWSPAHAVLHRPPLAAPACDRPCGADVRVAGLTALACATSMAGMRVACAKNALR